MTTDYPKRTTMIRFLENVGVSATMTRTPIDDRLPGGYRALMGAAALLIAVGFAVVVISVIVSVVSARNALLSWTGGGIVIAGLALRMAAFIWRVAAIIRYQRQRRSG